MTKNWIWKVPLKWKSSPSLVTDRSQWTESDDNSSHKQLFDSFELKMHIQNQFIRKLS